MNIQVKTEGSSGSRSLTGKVSLVTGSTSGIGLGIACALAEAGSAVVLNGFGVASEIAKTQDQIASDYGVKVSYSSADMTKPEAISEMIAATLAEHQSEWLVEVGTLLAVLGGVAAAVAFTTGITSRIDALGRNAARLAAGQPLHPVAAARDEVGD